MAMSLQYPNVVGGAVVVLGATAPIDVEWVTPPPPSTGLYLTVGSSSFGVQADGGWASWAAGSSVSLRVLITDSSTPPQRLTADVSFNS